MSFSAMVKREIYAAADGDRHCRLAMVSAIIAGAAKIEQARFSNPPIIRLKTDNLGLTRRFNGIFRNDFAGDAAKLLSAAGLWSNEHGFIRRINRMVTRADCCRRAYLTGLFLACGYVSDPLKAYHAEFQTGTGEYAEEVMEFLTSLGLAPHFISRKGRGPVVYFKDGEQIAEILKLVGAHASLMAFEDARIRKSIDNTINRSANFGAANVDKSIAAAVKQVENINLINKHSGLASLPHGLEELARLRLENPEMSLKEIGERLNPPVSKSGVNHRLRKIRDIAQNLEG